MSRRTLLNQLTNARDNFCGIGTKAVKLKLNALSKNYVLARALRIALQIEDCSTLGKKYFGEWSNYYYTKKSEHIHELIEIFETQNWVFGKQDSDAYGPKHIIYFELPGCEQISFHCTLKTDVPLYEKEWDGKRDSTLAKLETAITQLFSNLEKKNFEA